MKKSLLYVAAGMLFFATSCDSKPAEQVEDKMEETQEAVEETTEEAMEEEAMKSDKFADNPEGYYGEVINADGALMIDQFAAEMEGKDTLRTKIQAVVEDVCVNKGCWMKVQTADGRMMRIKFKDYGFFVPMDITGKEIVFEGIAYNDTTSVDDLKHYAKDGGQSDEEIAAITEPEINTSFLADGVMIVE